jgi:hypothetical protein
LLSKNLILRRLLQPQPVLLTNSAQILALHGSSTGPRTIYLRVEGANDATNAAWQRQLNESFSDCGCTTGKWATLLAFTCAIVLQLAGVMGPFHFSMFTLKAFGLAVVAAGAGKLIGLGAARLRVRAVAQAIREFELRATKRNQPTRTPTGART